MRKTPHCWKKEEEHNLIGRKGRLGEGQNVNDSSQMATWAKLARMRRRENGDNQSQTNKKHTSTNAYICDLENKANFSEAAFTTSYL